MLSCHHHVMRRADNKVTPRMMMMPPQWWLVLLHIKYLRNVFLLPRRCLWLGCFFFRRATWFSHFFPTRNSRNLSNIYEAQKIFISWASLTFRCASSDGNFSQSRWQKMKILFCWEQKGKINVHTRSLADDDDLITECVSSSTPDALRMWNMANDGGKWRNPSHVSLILILLLHEKQKRQKPTLNVHTAAKRACSMANREISDCIVYAMLAFMSRRKRSRQENKRR